MTVDRHQGRWHWLCPVMPAGFVTAGQASSGTLQAGRRACKPAVAPGWPSWRSRRADGVRLRRRRGTPRRSLASLVWQAPAANNEDFPAPWGPVISPHQPAARSPPRAPRAHPSAKGNAAAPGRKNGGSGFSQTGVGSLMLFRFQSRYFAQAEGFLRPGPCGRAARTPAPARTSGSPRYAFRNSGGSAARWC